MYTMIIWIVLWEVPYRYDRIKKSKQEKKKEATKRKKKLAKRKAKKALADRNETDLYNDITTYISRSETKRSLPGHLTQKDELNTKVFSTRLDLQKQNNLQKVKQSRQNSINFEEV